MPLVNPLFGHSGKPTFADARRDLEGTVVRSAAGVMRAGVFPDHLNPLVTGQSSMRIAIADFRGVQNRGGAVFLANVGTDTSVVLDAAPSANRRIDLVYVTMRSSTLGDTADTAIFDVVKGVASATPVAPSLPANLSTAIPLATVEIPAGATTTLSAGVIITQVYPYTAMAGGTVPVRNMVELEAWKPAAGGRAYCIADKNEYLRLAAAWGKPNSSDTTPITLTRGVVPNGFAGPSVTVSGGIATVVGRINNGNGLTLGASFQQVATLPAGARPDGLVIAPGSNASTASGVVQVASDGALSVAGSTAITFAFSYPVAS